MEKVLNKSKMFGNNVKKAAEKADLTVEALAEMTKFDKNMIENIISGNSDTVEKMTSDNVIKLSAALNVEEAELFSFSE